MGLVPVNIIFVQSSIQGLEAAHALHRFYFELYLYPALTIIITLSLGLMTLCKGIVRTRQA